MDKGDVLPSKDIKSGNAVPASAPSMVTIPAVWPILPVVPVALGRTRLVGAGPVQVPRCTRREVVIHPVVAQRDSA